MALGEALHCLSATPPRYTPTVSERHRTAVRLVVIVALLLALSATIRRQSRNAQLQRDWTAWRRARARYLLRHRRPAEQLPLRSSYLVP
jgi:hypothetical protein